MILARRYFPMTAALFAGLVFLAPAARAQMLTGYDEPPVQQKVQQQRPVPQKPPPPPQQVVKQPPPPVRASPQTKRHVRLSGPMLIGEPEEVPASAPLSVPFMAAEKPSYAAARQIRSERPPAPPGEKADDKAAPVDLTADRLVHDEKNRVITASGHVQLVQSGRTLQADEIVYNLPTDEVTAKGHVILSDVNGDIHFSDEVRLSNEMHDGFLQSLQSYLSDGGRLRAQNAQRKGGNLIILRDAAYTPCDCDESENGTPAWQLKAEKVTYDSDRHNIEYDNAYFELFGVPVLWTPYFEHSDGKEKRKSGLLTPDVGYNSKLGEILTGQYYWALAPDRDATTGIMAMSNAAPVLLGEYRQRFEHADIKLNGSATYSGRTDNIGGVDIPQKDEWRGHLKANGRWDIDDKWRAGANVEVASDDQYLRQYDFSGADVLSNEVRAERFSGRDYAVGRVQAFQDLRVLENRTDQPDVLPQVDATFEGEPNALLGGRWSVNASALGLRRAGNGQDVDRLSITGDWQRRTTTDFGLVSTMDLISRGDFYKVSDRDLSGLPAGSSGSASAFRAFPGAHLVSSWPFARLYENLQAVVEPIVSLTAATDVSAGNGKIPNEDSQDVQIDANNIFEPNRFPGFDRVEDKTHMTYGVRSGLYGYDNSYITAFGGQSYRLGTGENPFPDGSGLSTQASDYVGQLAGQYDDHFGFDYRFQLSSQNMAAQRHEASSYLRTERFSLDTRYLFAKALEGTDIQQSRQQIQNSAAYNIFRHWRLRGSALYDFGQESGFRKALAGIDYFGCCVSFSLTATRSFTTDSSGDNGTKIMLRMGLKGIGEFQTPESSTGLAPLN